MEMNDIDRDVVREVIRELSVRGEFRTKDVSTHPKMVVAHSAYLKASHYHAVVGKVISQESALLSLRQGRRNDRGTLWTRVG